MIVIEYNVWVVVGLVVIVAIAVPGTVTAVGLSVQIGVSVVEIAAVTWQVSATVPVNPEFSAGASWIVVDETPPGATADGDNAEGCSVNSEVPCPTAAVASATTAANKHIVTRDAFLEIILILDAVRSAFDMNRFCVNYLFQIASIPGTSKKLPAPTWNTPPLTLCQLVR